jgi:hypothetical protein
MSDYKRLSDQDRETNTEYCPKCDKRGEISDIRLPSYPPVEFATCHVCKVKWSFRGRGRDRKSTVEYLYNSFINEIGCEYVE